MRLTRPTLSMALFALLSVACVKQDIVPLVGEDPEVHALLDAETPPDPSTSALGAARRLTQAVSQRDAALVWALLGQGTRELLNKAAQRAGVRGPELLERSAIPGADGAWVPTSWSALLFGGEVQALEEVDARTVRAILTSGSHRDLVFEREEDGWKLRLSGLPTLP